MVTKGENELINTKVSAKRRLAVGDLKLTKLQIQFDLQTLNMIIAFLTKKSVLRTRKTLQNIRKLFTNIDPVMYQGNVEMEVRIWTIQQLVDVLIDGGFEDIEFAKTYCKDHATEEYQKEFIDTIGEYTIQYAESKYLVRKIDSTLEYGYVVTIRDVMLDILEQIDVTDYLSYESISNDLYQIATKVVNIKRQSRSLDADQTFSLSDEVFESAVSFAVDKLRDRNRIFLTGCRYLNTILSPGFLSKRLYIYLAFRNLNLDYYSLFWYMVDNQYYLFQFLFRYLLFYLRRIRRFHLNILLHLLNFVDTMYLRFL